jgi:ubiquinone/menaquinone biosynthesis C-methylase UbiE
MIAVQAASRSAENLSTRMTGWFSWSRNRQYVEWTLSKLNVQPYQHILEVGYGAGHILEEVGRALKIGFLAGIESSLPLYQQAYRRNKRLIRQQLLQLHIGELHELSYPSHYFHTIYGSNIHYSWKDPATEFIRLSSLLKSRGRLVMLFQSRTRKDAGIREAAERIGKDYLEAGLTDIRIEYRSMYPATVISATGFKA